MPGPPETAAAGGSATEGRGTAGSTPGGPTPGAPTPEGPAAEPPADGRRTLLLRWLSAFGRFWWDFLVGDTPELFVGTVVAVAAAAVLAHEHIAGAVVVPLLPLLAALMLCATVLRGRSRTEGGEPTPQVGSGEAAGGQRAGT